ncbi:hypothetical protein [Pantoea sp. SM3]|uniref:hypothetical protein n=1 Tax=Pantoea sp. SM3 TaxID=1628192 RepID=UPI000695EA7E|nr:hypothetical protein [Pantoea sp. SM3]
MNISRLAVERLLKINWFINIGKKTVSQSVRQVTNNSDFVTEITNVDWENTTLEAGNEITGHLAKKHTKDYQEWNVIVREAKKIIDNELLPLLRDKGVSEDVIIDSLKWDFFNFLM